MPKTIFPSGAQDRTYYVSPCPPRRKSRRRTGLFPAIFAGFLLFFAGFLLGQTTGQAAEPELQIPVQTLKIPENSGQNQLNSPNPSWNLILINQNHPLSQDYTPPELTQLKNGHAIDSRAYPDLQDMMDAARAEGLQPLICSSFRTWEKQEELFQNKAESYINSGYTREKAEETASLWVARPGTSEHQAALAVDIVDVDCQVLDENQENTPVQQWLMENCAQYGFILRYPTDKSAVTGVGYEPWHYRYVGKEAAREIMDRGICLEEYLDSMD